MFEKILKYDVYSKIYTLNTKHKNHPKIKTYKLYKKYNDLINEVLITGLKRLQVNDKIILSSYYKSSIEK